ncbi:MAG TPA: acyl-CoA dehydrogenase family protein [Burkholderiales bacterium]|jgi:acyl-CoA dehydrogenase|nr:acyl-CoA dehydrogenase family protein [Burkholderiales bacterium]
MAATAYESPWINDDVRIFGRTVRQFVEKEFVPHQARWRAQYGPDAAAWTAAGRAGILLADVPEEYGGGGGSFAHEAVVLEELARAGVHFGSAIQSTVAHYILAYGNEEQKRKWLPRMARGERVAAIAMTEPGAGSDLQAIKTTALRDGEHYVVSGSKTFITNGAHAGLVCLAVKTDPKVSGMRAISLLMVETEGLTGYRVGRPLEKIGMHGQDTCELFFDGVRVPAANLLGPAEGRGFAQMMEQLPYERLQIALGAVASAEQAIVITTRYAKERKAFGKPLFDLQNTRFKLAECRAKAQIGRVFVDSCIARSIAGQLDEPSTAMAKYWLTETQCQIIDECLQLHGGYGYMTEYPIARMWADSRVQRIYAGSNEIMKELIAWSL